MERVLTYLQLHGIRIQQEGRQPLVWYLFALIEIYALLGVRKCGRIVQWTQRMRLGERCDQ